MSLYQRAGFEANVVIGGATDSDPNKNRAERAYLRVVPRTFAPAVDDATLALGSKEMAQTGQPAPLVPIDPNDNERKALVAAISKLLPADIAAQMGAYEATLDTASINNVPLVAVKVDGKTQYANPLFSDAVFGVSMTDGALDPAPATDPAPKVTVELFVSTTADPMKRISVAKGTYGAEELVGRQILVQFAPATDIETLAHSWLRFRSTGRLGDRSTDRRKRCLVIKG